MFDLDGTLVDSAPAIRAVANELLARIAPGIAPLSLAETRALIGNGASAFLHGALETRAINDPGAFASRLALFLEIYEAAPGDANVAYRGAVAAIAELRRAGHRIGLCTNKPTGPTISVLEALGLGEAFAAVVAGDTLAERKPHPAPLIETVRRLGGGPALYVGDSEVDAETAAAAGIDFVLHTEGYRKAPVDRLVHAARFSDFQELAVIVDRLAGGRGGPSAST